MKLTEISTDPESLQACAKLLASAFPHATHLNSNYLTWLYRDNPAGRALGYNAWEGDHMVGHYAAIPVDLWLNGAPSTGLLALNTAMHPDYRNAGVIYSLANKTAKHAIERGFSCIYAVANEASTSIMLKTLKFQFVAQLKAAIGPVGLSPNWEKALQNNRFRRRWNSDSTHWRAANPSNPSALKRKSANLAIYQARTPVPGVFAHGLIPVEDTLHSDYGNLKWGLKLFLGLLPKGSCRYPGYLPIPESLKPSPLNLIYRPLSKSAPSELARDEVILGVHDFDPY